MAVVEPIVVRLGYELVSCRFMTDQGRPVLRLLIDKGGGVTVADCEKVSREIETPLEIESLLTHAYQLEVSSPGLDRPLVSESDFQRFVGQKIFVHTEEPIEGRRNYKGILNGIEEGIIRMVIDGENYEIPFGKIQKAHIVYEGGK